jgi:SAM-dependent methyltransferase
MVTNPTAFDAFAETYDDNFTYSRLGKLLRPRVWARLGCHFAADQRVLELTCGPGEDALWLAGRGVHITAIDGSAEMIRVARLKIEAAGLADRITTCQLSLQELIAGEFDDQLEFDGAYSNFGGLNTIDAWRGLAQALAKLVKPGGKLILVPMGPLCPWEIIWHLIHLQAGSAFRRFRRAASAKIGDTLIPIWYPSARRLRRDFAPWFDHLQTESLGLWLPPTYLDHFVERWLHLFVRLNRLEQSMTGLSQDWGDHYIITFQRRG